MKEEDQLNKRRQIRSFTRNPEQHSTNYWLTSQQRHF